MAEQKKRRSFTPEYRVEAAGRVIESGRPVAHVARELGLGDQLLGKWVRDELAKQAGELTGVLSVDERAELKRLRREVAELRRTTSSWEKQQPSRRSHHGRTVRTDGGGEGQLRDQPDGPAAAGFEIGLLPVGGPPRRRTRSAGGPPRFWWTGRSADSTRSDYTSGALASVCRVREVSEREHRYGQCAVGFQASARALPPPRSPPSRGC